GTEQRARRSSAIDERERRDDQFSPSDYIGDLRFDIVAVQQTAANRPAAARSCEGGVQDRFAVSSGESEPAEGTTASAALCHRKGGRRDRYRLQGARYPAHRWNARTETRARAELRESGGWLGLCRPG